MCAHIHAYEHPHVHCNMYVHICVHVRTSPGQLQQVTARESKLPHVYKELLADPSARYAHHA